MILYVLVKDEICHFLVENGYYLLSQTNKIHDKELFVFLRHNNRRKQTASFSHILLYNLFKIIFTKSKLTPSVYYYN